jgi:hypothetical protein
VSYQQVVDDMAKQLSEMTLDELWQLFPIQLAPLSLIFS